MIAQILFYSFLFVTVYCFYRLLSMIGKINSQHKQNEFSYIFDGSPQYVEEKVRDFIVTYIDAYPDSELAKEYPAIRKNTAIAALVSSIEGCSKHGLISRKDAEESIDYLISEIEIGDCFSK
jgi:hypothetical protein